MPGVRSRPSLPFLDRVCVVIVLCSLIAVVVSLLSDDDIDKVWTNPQEFDFRTPTSFNIGAMSVTAILVALYASWW